MFGTVLDQLETMVDDLQTEIAASSTTDVDGADAAATLLRLERVRERIDASTSAVIADLDARELHRRDAAGSMANWIAPRTGQRRAEVGSRVHLARKLTTMPATIEAWLAGDITASHAQVLCRALNPRTVDVFARDETILVGAAKKLTADQLVQVVEHWLRHADPDGTAPVEENDRFFLSQTMGGRLKGSFDLGGDLAMRVKLGFDELTEQLRKQDQANRAADPTDPGLSDSVAQRRARALGELCDRAASSSANPARRQPLYTLHTTIATLSETGDPLDWTTQLEQAWSAVIPRFQIELDTCDCWIQQLVINGQDGGPLAAGREIRVANRAMRRALVARDGNHCAVPGCTMPVHRCDAHHIFHWLDGGETELGNLVFLCRWHHTRIHKHELRVEVIDGRPRFTLPDGRVLTDPRGDPPQVLAA